MWSYNGFVRAGQTILLDHMLTIIQLANGVSHYIIVDSSTVWRETLEGSNIGKFGKKPSIRQF